MRIWIHFFINRPNFLAQSSRAVFNFEVVNLEVNKAENATYSRNLLNIEKIKKINIKNVTFRL